MTAFPVSPPEDAAFRAALEGDAFRAVVAARIDQLRQGHDPDADALLPLDALPRKAKEYLAIADECIRGIHGRQDLPRARRKLAQACALLLAAIDRLALAIPSEERLPL